MEERKIDKKLGIRTVGIREWNDNNVQYNRYEPTPYKALAKLCKIQVQGYQPNRRLRIRHAAGWPLFT